MFSRLSESIKKTTSIADGYKLGRLVFEEEEDGSWTPRIEIDTKKKITKLDDAGDEINKYGDNIAKILSTGYVELEITNFVVEVLNDSEWYRMTEEDYQRVTAEGWPLFGGFDCRFKMKGED